MCVSETCERWKEVSCGATGSKEPRSEGGLQITMPSTCISSPHSQTSHPSSLGRKEGLDKVALVYTRSGYLRNCCEGPCDEEAAVGGRCHVLLPRMMPFLELPSPGLRLLFGDGSACEQLERKSEYIRQCRQD